MSRLLALFGFAASETQKAVPPLLAYILAVPVSIFAASLMEALTFFMVWLSFGWLERVWVSIAFRTVGTLGGLVLLHSVYRLLVHRDDCSWGGWLRRLML